MVVIIAIVAATLRSSRSSAAATAFGDAMQIYQAPLATPGEPLAPGAKAYPYAKARAAAAPARSPK